MIPRTGETAFTHPSCNRAFQSSTLTQGTIVLTSTKHDYVILSFRPQWSATFVWLDAERWHMPLRHTTEARAPTTVLRIFLVSGLLLFLPL